MVLPAGSSQRLDGGVVSRPTRPVARWTALGLLSTAGFALFGLVPAHDDARSPLPPHQHAVLTSGTPDLRRLSLPQLPDAQVGVHGHTTSRPGPSHQEMGKVRVSPHQLSLGKW